MKTYDIAFVGLGASSLAYLKIKYEKSSLSIIGIDKNFNKKRNNFFAFWLTNWMKEFESVITYQWESWEFTDYNKNIKHYSTDMPYSVIRFQDWKNYCLKEINNFSCIESNVLEIKNIDEGYLISLDNGEKISAKKIYDSRNIKPKADCLKQHFIGHIIETETTHDHHVAKLMDFRVPQEEGLHFIYVLPLDDKKLLVESTIFSKRVLNDKWYETQIEGYINKFLKINGYRLIEKERGVLPMFEIKSKNDGNYINIGSRDGATKISSGYAFSFFLKKILYEKEYYHSFLDNWMDKIFVNYLENNRKSDEIFIRMASALNGKEFASFMMGIADIKIKFKVILSMPKIGFIKSFLSSFK